MTQPILCTTHLSIVAPAIQSPLGLTPVIETIPDEEWIDDDETPLFVEPFCAEPPTTWDDLPFLELEPSGVLVVADSDAKVPFDEPEAILIGPHTTEAVLLYEQREPYACVW